MQHRGDFTLVHGSPREPIWEYLLSAPIARENFAYFETKYCMVGHSHVPLLFEYLDQTDSCLHNQLPTELSLQSLKGRLIINPGGVGQPRDGDPRSSYALIDIDKLTISHYRIPYDISVTQQKMSTLGLPTRLITRLNYGI